MYKGWTAVSGYALAPEAVRKLQKAGWQVARQKGFHVMMTNEGYEYTLSIPQHPELGPGILRKIIRQANLSVDEFNKL